MVRFLCFNAPIQYHKPKKTVEAMHKTLQDSSQIQAPKASLGGTSLNVLLPRTQENAQVSDDTKDATRSGTIEPGWKSDEINAEENIETSRLLRKSQSLGSGLCNEGSVLCDNDTEDGMDQGFSSDSLDHNGLVAQDGSKDTGISPASQNKRSVQVTSDLIRESIFSIDDPLLSEKGPEISDVLSGEGANESGNHTPRSTHTLVKSHSLPNFGPTMHTSGRHSYRHLTTHSRSSEDLQVLGRWKGMHIHETETQVVHEHEGDDNMHKTGKNDLENSHDETYDCYNYSATAKDWIMPLVDEVNTGKNLQGQSSARMFEEFPGKDFKIKRIEEWVNELQHCGPLEDANGFVDTNDVMKRDSTMLNGLNVSKVDNMVTPGMEAAKRYISSLSASATTAQLSNHGLVVIPFLSAFVSLRVLNLSGNSLVRITAGALPRGLHMLNLSRNNISAIEGLRELTRLRVLDLSYNRIFRIGHGLASCCSLKELYLAGNKISEVEGLHRLLKLTVLDLRFNKISTAKCLGQLAANYNSLQAISLEGNPAQKNVGDEQVKKYLQGLLPNLVYFNRQPIKASTLKDAADRSVRLGISGHRKADNKAARKTGHGLGGSRLSSSSTHRRSQAVVSPKRSRGRRVHLPPSGTKAIARHQQLFPDLSNKLLNLRSELAIRRSRSEGTLAAL